MKVGDLVRCVRAYNARGVIVSVRKENSRKSLTCDVWLMDIDKGIKKRIYTFMDSQLVLI
tara:strand:- start:384 stop:563 length:180 start_codon:yes stop_codon:yes gene_type:complete